jgi:hypothetical protein
MRLYLNATTTWQPKAEPTSAYFVIKSLEISTKGLIFLHSLECIEIIYNYVSKYCMNGT